MRVEFVDALRGYRFATEMRRRMGHPNLHVWHRNATVLVEFPEEWESREGIAALVAESGGLVASAA